MLNCDAFGPMGTVVKRDLGAVAGLIAGLLGLALGVAAAIWEVVAFGVVAGSLAMVGGISVWRLVELLGGAREKIDELEVAVDQLRDEVTETSLALADRIDATATRTGPPIEDNLTDHATGLYSEAYFDVALDHRIATARRRLRPVAVVLLDVIEGLDHGRPHPASPRPIADTIRVTLRESDTACRLRGGGYALVLEDTPENGAIWTAERLRRAMSDHHRGLTLWAGVACYPAHGFTSTEVLARARDALDAAREWRQDRIEVATAID